MFESYFGLTANPFTIAPNPNYLYLSEQHREALAHLQYGLHENGGFILLTGEVGTGKTTIWRCLVEQLDQQTRLALLLNPCLTAHEMLETICDEFGISYQPDDGSKRLIDALNAFLLKQNENNVHCVLIVEEAQNLSDELLEQLRLLTNLETNEKKLLQIILIGQPELVHKIEQPELRQLKQRIIARYHLRPLNKDEIKTYVEHRLTTANGTINLFSDKALALLTQKSGGIPRIINLICERALLGCFGASKRVVDSKIMHTAIDEILSPHQIEPIARKSEYAKRIKRPAMLFATAFSILLSATIALFIYTDPITPLQQALFTTATDSKTPLKKESPPLPPTQTQNESPKTISFAKPLYDDLRSAGLLDRNRESITKLAQASLSDNPYSIMFKLWGVNPTSEFAHAPCQYGIQHNLDCWHRRGQIASLKRLNRPAVLKLVSMQGNPFYAALTMIDDSTEQLQVEVGDVKVSLSEAQLKEIWTGEYTVFWRRPSGYRNTIYPGDKNDAVIWLTRNLANLTGDSSLTANTQVYTVALENRIRKFQSDCGLFVDGLIGKETLIKINTMIDKMPVLNRQHKTCNGLG